MSSTIFLYFLLPSFISLYICTVCPYTVALHLRLLSCGLADWVCRLFLFLPELEDVPEIVEFSTPDETDSVHTGVAFKPVVDVLFVEQLQILRGVLVQAIFHRHIVEERLLLSHHGIVA